MKIDLLYSLSVSFCSLGFCSCNEDDPVVPQNSAPTLGKVGNGAGSGGISPNSMKVKMDKSTVNLKTVSGSAISGMGTANGILISGFDSISTLPSLQILINSTLNIDTFFIKELGAPELSYFTDSNQVYVPIAGYIFIQNLDTSIKLVNGRFEAIMVDENNPLDSLVFTKEQFTKFYNYKTNSITASQITY